MADYEPLDLSKWCNADAAVLGEDQRLALGRQTMRGLPFMVGPEEADAGRPCLIALSGADGSLSIPFERRARRVIVAHSMLESSVPEDGFWGREVAEYVFHLAGGAEDRVFVRERFEIGAPPSVGAIPGGPGLFRAVPDQDASVMPRHEGEWGRSGWRPMEAQGGGVGRYYLWVWSNPHPDRAIKSLEVVPHGPRFIIGAVTLGHLGEHPFAREGRRPVLISLTDPKDAGEPFDVDVTVDRGDATYAHPLPAGSAEEFMDDPYKGWGEPQNEHASPSYVEISAVPSATVAVSQGQKEVASVSWGEVQQKGVVETPKARLELLDRGRNWVHVTVLDDETGKPVPCRVHFRSSDGVPFQPHGHHNHVNSNLDSFNFDVGGDIRFGQITYAYIDGTCQGWLPRGEVIVDVARGFEYEPMRARVQIEPGQRELTLRLKRWTNMNANRWYSGDSHVHFLSAQGAHAEAQAEGLNVVNLLQSQWGSLFTNVEDFTGEPHVSRSGDSIVYVSQENRQHFMGHALLWGLKRHVMPWCSDGLGEAEIGGTMEITLSDWADQTHAQGGTVVAAHFWGLNREAAALIATNRLDAIELKGHQRPFPHSEYYRALNCGYRLPLVGGTDKMSSDVAVGHWRTYVKLPDDEEFTYDSWCRNVARGRTFLTSGPIIGMSVEGREIGETVSLSGPGTVEIEVWAESIHPIHRLDIVQAGHVVASTESQQGTRRLEMREKIRVDGHTWLAARCGSPSYFGDPDYDRMQRGIYAHTSPTYVECGGDWQMFDQRTAQHMLNVVEGDLAYVSETAAQYPHGLVTHHHGEDDHVAYLQRPFKEARDALQARMREHDVDG